MSPLLGLYLEVIEETIRQAATVQSPAVLEQLKQRWIAKLEEKIEKRQTSQPVETKNVIDDDEGWGDADWEEADHSTTSADIICTNTQNNNSKNDAKIRSNNDSKNEASIQANNDANVNTGNANKSFTESVKTETVPEFLPDDESEIDDATLSDLDDAEPITSDIVVSQFESVQRPHSRKPRQKGLWRIKLKNGVMQIDGQEMLFGTLGGELKF